MNHTIHTFDFNPYVNTNPVQTTFHSQMDNLVYDLSDLAPLEREMMVKEIKRRFFFVICIRDDI